MRAIRPAKFTAACISRVGTLAVGSSKWFEVGDGWSSVLPIFVRLCPISPLCRGLSRSLAWPRMDKYLVS